MFLDWVFCSRLIPAGRSMYPTPRTVWIIGSLPESIFFLRYEMYRSTMLVRPAKS